MWLAWCPAKTEGKSPTIDKLEIKNYKMSEETIYHKQEPERTTEGLAAPSIGVNRPKMPFKKRFKKFFLIQITKEIKERLETIKNKIRVKTIRHI